MKNLVILGASGNLAKVKLFPALWEIFQKGYKCNYIGYGRTRFSNKEFRKIVKDCVKDSNEDFISRFFYMSGGYDVQGLKNLKRKLTKGNTTFYLSLPTRIDIIQDVIYGLKKNDLLTGQFQLVVEKPFGTDYTTASDLMNLLKRDVGKKNLFLIDHYLLKNLVRNLVSLRFANPIFENIWNNKFIKKIEIQAMETVGIDGRGQYYDTVGAIKDMIQNHMLQVLSLVLMNQPALLDPFSIEKEKISILENLHIFKDSFEDNIKIAQYRGYLDESYVKKDSLTETYAMLKVEVDSERWRKVPIILKTGKKQKEKKTQISISFKGFKKCLWSNNCKSITANKLVINIYPKNEIKLYINSNIQRAANMKQIPLRFNFSNNFGLLSPYANALISIYNKDKRYSLSTSEILLSWKFIDQVEEWINNRRRKLLKIGSAE